MTILTSRMIPAASGSSASVHGYLFNNTAESQTLSLPP